jgi:hypothetical protein
MDENGVRMALADIRTAAHENNMGKVREAADRMDRALLANPAPVETPKVEEAPKVAEAPAPAPAPAPAKLQSLADLLKTPTKKKKK